MNRSPWGLIRRSQLPGGHPGTILLSLAALIAIGACADSPTSPQLVAPPSPPVVTSVGTRAFLADAIVIDYSDHSADSVRAVYRAADGSDAGSTPWFSVAHDSLVVLGLRPATQYAVTLQAKRGSFVATGATTTQTTAALPPALQQVQMTILSGGEPSGGYTLTNVNASDGHGYAIAFDSTGSIRWYHDVGAMAVSETKQQPNGDITMYAGNTRGFDPVPGAYVEITPGGDSVRSIAATGSPYTDQHELVTTYDASGARIADYLFGYDIRSVDRTAIGGGPADPVAGHQVLRIAASGTVDTLVNGWTTWSASDYVDPFSTGDMDHPNSIDIDHDGGVIISYRDLDAIVKVDPATHVIEWQLGGARNQFRFVNDPQSGFGGQHDVRVLPNGHLLLFDNGTNHSPQASRAVEYAIDPVAKTATMVWQYVPNPPVFNTFTGSAQRLANGNTVVAWTLTGVIDEVSPNGTLLSRTQVTSAPGSPSAIYRATRIASLYRYTAP
jgi:hypothetical protein